MGSYLSEPVKDAASVDEAHEELTYGATSMQGWRTSQEDAHNCIPKFDENASLFAVYDGHGGAEVAQYCAQHLPTTIKHSEAYKNGDYKTALTEAFIKFDKSLQTKDCRNDLKALAELHNGEAMEDDEDEESDEDLEALHDEATAPLEEVLATHYQASPHKEEVKEEVKGEGEEKGEAKVKENKLLSGVRGGDRIRASPALRPKRVHGGGESEKVVISEIPADTDTPGEVRSETAAIISEVDEGEDKKGEDKEGKKVESESLKIEEVDVKKLTNGESSTEDKVMDGEVEEKPVVVTPSEEESDDNDADVKQGKQSSSSSSTPGGSSSNAGAAPAPSSSSSAAARAGSSKGVEQAEEDDDDDDEEDEDFVLEEGGEGEDDDEEGGGDDDDDDDEEEDDDDDDDSDDESCDAETEKEDGKVMLDFLASSSTQPGDDSGSTAVVVLRVGKEIYVANAGDSRCVLSRDGVAVDLSVDHKPEDEGESVRIKAAGGRVTGDGRVNGGLNLSRAIGDLNYKLNDSLPWEKQMITPLPDVTVTTLTDKDDFLLVACDGIWNSMTSQEAVNFVKEQMAGGGKVKLSGICEEMCTFCLAPDTQGDGTGCDNMTAILITFHHSQRRGQGRAVRR